MKHLFYYLYSPQSGFEISPFNQLFLREDLGEFIKEKKSQNHFHNSISYK